MGKKNKQDKPVTEEGKCFASVQPFLSENKAEEPTQVAEGEVPAQEAIEEQRLVNI
jgi:hypothetical protein